ncbi:Crp/Fnr family transcriptional regulator, partial [Actinomadura sediminis]
DGFFDALDGAQRAALRRAGSPYAYPARAPLCYQGEDSDHIIVIESGWAKVASGTEDGREIILAVRGPGDLVCESAVLGSRQRSATVTALSAVRALIVPAARFTAFLDAHPGMWLLVSGTFVRRLDDADRRLQASVSAQGARRLALLLADLADLSVRHAPPAPDGGVEIAPPLSQEELGGCIDASRETVARALAVLRDAGLVRTARRRIAVRDASALRAFAENALD